MDSQHTVTQSNKLERVTALIEHQERRASRFYVTVGLSVASLMISSVLIWQLAEYRTERRADAATRIAYEPATQNVINLYMGQNEESADYELSGGDVFPGEEAGKAGSRLDCGRVDRFAVVFIDLVDLRGQSG